VAQRCNQGSDAPCGQLPVVAIAFLGQKPVGETTVLWPFGKVTLLLAAVSRKNRYLLSEFAATFTKLPSSCNIALCKKAVNAKHNSVRKL
jgi:hypothetical protein